MPHSLLDIRSTVAARVDGDAAAGALAQARRSWFDTAAAILGGSRERCTAAAVASIRCPGSTGAIAPWDEALVLGTASHALDFDDVCMLATCHPSAPVATALLSLLPVAIQARPGLRFGAVLSAYLIGTEVMLRLGERLGFRHHALGFHATGTLGAVGAAAACAQLLGLSQASANSALSIGASNAGGLRANFGTDVKPLHVGFAAAAGVRAALLARAGAIGSDEVWGETGFERAFNGAAAVDATRWTPATPWAIESPGFEHKRYPSCYLTHRLIAGVLALRRRLGSLPIAETARLDIEVPKTSLSALRYPAPTTGLQGKFSGQYCAAAAWLDGQVGLGSFTDQAVARAPIVRLMSHSRVHERNGADEPLDSSPVTVRVEVEGQAEAIVVDWAPGSQADPMTVADFRRKWADCAAHAGADSAATLANVLLEAPDSLPASEVLGPLRRFLLGAVGALERAPEAVAE